MRIRHLCIVLKSLIFAATLNCVQGLSAEVGDDFIPRKQSAPPGPPLSPEEALRKMVVPEGFRVELVASEPDLQNPVAMAFDDRGRIFVTESFEYPRREAGPGRDRIKILEDKDGDGVAETVKVFAEGLNIPSGIAVGHGGVWVANAPDILFLEDTDGDDRADKTTVVVTGFGRDDTHELPNALTWGPDGALYGLNGVFNPSHIVQNGKTTSFTCAMFRIDPKTHQLDVFSEGTSNPWGIAFDHEGSAFVSACVIDHLWHLTESAYYRRQAGTYPPHTFFAESIVSHKHQMAAYCGIEFLDTDAYPSIFNNKLYMGNIHGGCINSDSIVRHGATYKGSGNPDFLTANDVWFMPVAQKVGPDGCLYVLDWYDRYHCYQDANADPKGVDRGHGRLYRIVHDKRPAPRIQDFSKLTPQELLETLQDPNIFNRQRAQLKIQEMTYGDYPLSVAPFVSVINDKRIDLKYRLHALWAITGTNRLKTKLLITDLLTNLAATADEPEVRAWIVRSIGRQYGSLADLPPKLKNYVVDCAADADPRVRIEVSIASAKLAKSEDDSAWNVANQLRVLQTPSVAALSPEQDPILSRVIWQNLLPHMQREKDQIASSFAKANSGSVEASLSGRFVSFLLANSHSSTGQIAANSATDIRKVSNIRTVFDLIQGTSQRDKQAATELLSGALSALQKREISIDVFKPELQRWLADATDEDMAIDPQDRANWDRWDRCLFQCQIILGDTDCFECAKAVFADASAPSDFKREILATANLVNSDLVKSALGSVVDGLRSQTPVDEIFRDSAIDLGIGKFSRSEASQFAELIPGIPVALQTKIVERMCQRGETVPAILELIEAQKVRKELVSPNTIRILAQSQDAQVQSLVQKIWGTINVETTKDREVIVASVTEKLNRLHGDAERGWVVFDRTCGQCHVMHGRGAEVGPNITSNGRGAFDQLLISVFNPSLVIGDAYRGATIRTVDEEIITGLLVEQSDVRTVLRLQGGKERVVPAEEIDAFKVDSKSLMPEGLETQLSDQDLADLFALLALEKAPGASGNVSITGTPAQLHAPAK